MRKNIFQPPDRWEAYVKSAERAGMSLSEWIEVQCNAAIPKSVLNKFIDRPSVGSPGSSRKQSR